jgi:hypothetical protein
MRKYTGEIKTNLKNKKLWTTLMIGIVLVISGMMLQSYFALLPNISGDEVEPEVQIITQNNTEYINAGYYLTFDFSNVTLYNSTSDEQNVTNLIFNKLLIKDYQFSYWDYVGVMNGSLNPGDVIIYEYYTVYSYSFNTSMSVIDNTYSIQLYDSDTNRLADMLFRFNYGEVDENIFDLDFESVFEQYTFITSNTTISFGNFYDLGSSKAVDLFINDEYIYYELV